MTPDLGDTAHFRAAGKLSGAIAAVTGWDERWIRPGEKTVSTHIGVVGDEEQIHHMRGRGAVVEPLRAVIRAVVAAGGHWCVVRPVRPLTPIEQQRIRIALGKYRHLEYSHPEIALHLLRGLVTRWGGRGDGLLGLGRTIPRWAICSRQTASVYVHAQFWPAEIRLGRLPVRTEDFSPDDCWDLQRITAGLQVSPVYPRWTIRACSDGWLPAGQEHQRF